MPKYFLPGSLAGEGLGVQDFCVAPREGNEDVGFVVALEHWAGRQVQPDRPLPSLIRRATDREIARFWEIKTLERRALVTCKEKVVAHGLPMKVFSCRFEARNNKLAFQFTSDKRVDFRALVRDLAGELRCRIELWQVGVREETRIQDGYGICGLRTCCSSWIKDFRPINLKMAKEQDIDLPPSKLTGQCGRLLCCLSYEVEAYRELSQHSLPKGTTVVHSRGQGVIVDRNLIRRQYIVGDAQGALSTINASDIREFSLPEQMKHMGKKVREGLARDLARQETVSDVDTMDTSLDDTDTQADLAGRTEPVLSVSPTDSQLREPTPAPAKPSGHERPSHPEDHSRLRFRKTREKNREREAGSHPSHPPRRGRGGRRGGRNRPHGGGGPSSGRSEDGPGNPNP